LLAGNNYKLEKTCNITSVEPGALRGIDLINLECEDLKVGVDMISSINVFSPGEKVKLVIAKSKPEFGERDFCGHGYVVTEKRQSNKYVTLISIFGPLIRIESENSFLSSNNLSIMDHVYVCLLKS